MAYENTILAASNLISYWKLDEASGTTIDDAFASNNLTLAGTATYGSDPLMDDGVDSITFSRSGLSRASLSTCPVGQYDFAVEGWFQATDLTTVRQCIFFNGQGSTGLGLFLNTDTSNGNLYILFQNVAWKNTGFQPSTDPHHFVVTRGGVGTPLRLYVDGVEVYNTSDVGNAPVGGFIIGGEKIVEGDNGFNGILDDISVYNAEMASNAVAAHYIAGGGTVDLPVKSAQTGNWNNPATWMRFEVPDSSEAVTIATGHTITVSDSQTCDGWIIEGAGLIAITGTGTLTSGTATCTIHGDGSEAPKITVAAGGQLLWSPTGGGNVTVKCGTDYYRYCKIKLNGTSGSHCKVGKAVGTNGTISFQNGDGFIWANGLFEADYTDFIAVGLNDFSLRSTTFYLHNCTMQGGGCWKFSYWGTIDWADNKWTGTLGSEGSAQVLGSGSGAAGGTIVRCDFDKGAGVSGNFGGSNPGMMSIEDCIFRGPLVGSGWNTSYITSSGHLFHNRSAQDNTLSANHTNCYQFIDYSADSGAGNPHFWVSNGSTTLEDFIFEYRGPYNVDTGDCFLLQAGTATLRRCIILPSPVPGRPSGGFGWIGDSGQLIIEHCTLYASGTNSGVGFPHGVNMSADQVVLKSNLFWNDQAGGPHLAVRNDSPAFSDIDALSAANCINNVFEGMTDDTNDVNGVPTSLNGFSGCEFSVAPTVLEFDIGGSNFVDKTRNFINWGRSVLAHSGTDDQVRDNSLTDIENDKTLVRDSLIPWVQAGYSPQNATLSTAAHDGTTVGAVEFSNTSIVNTVGGFGQFVGAF